MFYQYKSVRQRCYHLVLLVFFLQVLGTVSEPKVIREQQQEISNDNCEILQVSLTYTQATAPRDLSAVLPVVVDKVNQALDGVVDVEVEWSGADLHGSVGEHLIKCKVTRLTSLAAASMDDANKNDATTATSDASDDPDKGNSVMTSTTQCFHVPFTILDIDECTLPKRHPMRHNCHQSSICINTVGSYECLCPKLGGARQEIPKQIDDENVWNHIIQPQQHNPWERSLNYSATAITTSNAVRNSDYYCINQPSTYSCCKTLSPHNTQEGKLCRSNFRCPIDPCSHSEKNNDCAANAHCTRKDHPYELPKNYLCQCPDGLMGNGHACRVGIDPKPEPKLMFDGVTPTPETIKNDMYCGCTKPVLDPCSGFPPCANKNEVCTINSNNSKPSCECRPNFFRYEPLGTCVDEQPPVLKLLGDKHGDQIQRLKQGDIYEEYFVDILDENKEDYLRSLKITWSKPMRSGSGKSGCILQTGEFHVNYTISTPWTTPPYQRITRRVIIDDIDECQLNVAKYMQQCPELLSKCAIQQGATCINTIGSYTCRCPSLAFGDGFQPLAKYNDRKEEKLQPGGYQGGTGCKDIGKPVIRLFGPNPKKFRVPLAGGIQTIMGGNGGSDNQRSNNDKYHELRMNQRSRYENDIVEIIRSSSGSELCATHSNSNPKPTDCFEAYDKTYNDTIDLTHKVIIGDRPIPKGQKQNKNGENNYLHWSIPYNVYDDAGNQAITVYRDIIIEEVDLNDYENQIRGEISSEQQITVDKAVSHAIKKEKKEASKHASASKQQKVNCPQCPKCDIGSRNGMASKFDASHGKKNDKSPPVCDVSAMGTSKEQAELLSKVENSLFIHTMLLLENYFPPSLVPLIFICMIALSCLIILPYIISNAFYPSDQRRYENEYSNAANDIITNTNFANGGSNKNTSVLRAKDEKLEKSMENSVKYYQGSDGATTMSSPSLFNNDANTQILQGSIPPSTSLTQQMLDNNESNNQSSFFLTPTNRNNVNAVGSGRTNAFFSSDRGTVAGSPIFSGDSNSRSQDPMFSGDNRSQSKNRDSDSQSQNPMFSGGNRSQSKSREQLNGHEMEDIYRSPSIISPSKFGDGVARRQQRLHYS